MATGIMYEVGAEYIYVTGECRYWVSAKSVGAQNEWSPTRIGTLTDERERELMTTFSYDTWADDAGSYGPDRFLGGGPSLILFDGENRVHCQKPCDASAPKYSRALEDSTSQMTPLYQEGVDARGAMRFRAFETERPPVELVAWPLSTPPGSIEVWSDRVDRIHGPATVVAADNDLAALRKLRSSLGARAVPSAAYAEHPDPLLSYGFAFRDVVPFEDSNGQVQGIGN